MSTSEHINNAYAAGLVDGEGCITIENQRNHMYLLIQVCNTDPRVCIWLKERFGGAIRTQQQKNWKRMYRWAVTTVKAKEFLTAIYPYLIIKKEQADIAFAFLDTKGNRGRVSPDVKLYRETLRDDMKEAKRTIQ